LRTAISMPSQKKDASQMIRPTASWKFTASEFPVKLQLAVIVHERREKSQIQARNTTGSMGFAVASCTLDETCSIWAFALSVTEGPAALVVVAVLGGRPPAVAPSDCIMLRGWSRAARAG